MDKSWDNFKNSSCFFEKTEIFFRQFFHQDDKSQIYDQNRKTWKVDFPFKKNWGNFGSFKKRRFQNLENLFSDLSQKQQILFDQVLSFSWIEIEFIWNGFRAKLLATYKRAVWKNLTIVSVKIFGLKSPLASLRFFDFFASIILRYRC